MSADVSSAFVAPAFDQDVSLEAHLAECPEDAVTRGVFFESVQKLVQEHCGRVDDRLYEGLTATHWSQYKTYPLRDFLCLAHRAARLAYPKLPAGEGLRRIGWKVFPSFVSTMAGRVVLYTFGQALDDLVAAVPRSYALALPGSGVAVHRLGEAHVRIELRRVYSFAETYQTGVIEGPFRAEGGMTVQIRVRRYPRLCDVDFDLRWKKL